MGLDTMSSIQLLSQERGEATAVERKRMQLRGAETVLRTTRVRLHEAQPIMYETACLAVSRIPGLGDEDVGNYDIVELASRHGLALGPTHERATVAEASAEEARRLGIARHMPVLQLDRVIFAEGGLPIEWRLGVCHLPAPAPSGQRRPASAEC
jgi:DNA-binding GntR family transcriptional regulator